MDSNHDIDIVLPNLAPTHSHIDPLAFMICFCLRRLLLPAGSSAGSVARLSFVLYVYRAMSDC